MIKQEQYYNLVPVYTFKLITVSIPIAQLMVFQRKQSNKLTMVELGILEGNIRLLKNKLLRKKYKIYISTDKKSIELHSDGHLSLALEIENILNFYYFKPKQFIGSDKYWLSIKTKTNGNLFFPTQFSDDHFVKELLQLISYYHLAKMKRDSIKGHLAYYSFPLILFGIHFAKLGDVKLTILLVLGVGIFIFNTVGIYNEILKFKNYKEIKDSEK